VQSGKLRALAVTGDKRLSKLPERLADHLSVEIPKWGRIVRAANIRL
jgi:tripartite-type tricarboxylate transporter receptor subunit TctC